MTSLTDKYRPQRLEDVLGQGHILKSLKQVIHEKRAKAFIFSGPSGCGKTTLARILANRFSDGECSITNVSERDGAFASGAEAVRDLVSSVVYKALGASSVKSVIIDECHKLSNTAWNILLKPIEEPPPHVYWMLCTTEAGKIPNTIKTRCLSYNLRPVCEEELLSLICGVADAEGFKSIPDEVFEEIASEAGGSPRLALNLLEACHTFGTASEVRAYLRKAGESKEVIDLCRFIASDRGTWTEAMKLLKNLDEVEPESIRIQVINYLAAVAKNKADPLPVLRKIEAFAEAYKTSDKLAPLLISIGVAMGIGHD